MKLYGEQGEVIMELLNDFKIAKIIPSKIKHLEFAASFAKDGHVLEFGVRNARTFTPLTNYFHDRTIYGFDSFEGLPEKWVMSSTKTEPKGRFTVDYLPQVPENGKLVKGWFDDTLPIWIKEHKGSVAFLHIDSDLYSSCKTVLTQLNDRIVAGTVIVFDELCDWENKTRYKNWREGEWKALNEWTKKYNRKVKVLARTHLAEGSIIVQDHG